MNLRMFNNIDKHTFLAFLSGILVIFIFPNFNLSFLAWIALVPLLIALDGKTAGRSFRLGFLTGIVSFSGILYWIITTIIADGESPIFGILALLALSAVLAVFYGVFCAGYNLWKKKSTGSFITDAFFAAALWVVVEWARSVAFSGFPWALLGYSQWQNLSVIQISEFTAVYGVSFLIMFVNAVFKDTVVSSLKARRFNGYSRIAVILFVIILNAVYGSIRSAFYMNDGSNGYVNVAILQGNIDQYMKWDDTYESLIYNSYGSLVDDVMKTKNKPDIIVWPETSVPGYLRLESRVSEWVSSLAKKSGAYQIIGSAEYEGKKYYNSAFLIAPDGNIIERYDKLHLVPVGEYLPFRNIIEKVVPAIKELGDFTPGQGYKRFNTPYGTVSAVICYESIFPDLTRRIVGKESDFLVNITNDAWYLKTAALNQHFSMNVFRAVENRISIVRAANTGISGFIGKNGKVEKETGVGIRTFLHGEVIRRNGRITFYGKYGDVFVLVCGLFVIFAGFITTYKLPKKEVK